MIVLYLLIAGVIGSIATGFIGAYKGYQICTQSYQTKILKAENKRLALSLEYLKSSQSAAEKEAEDAKKLDQLNQAVIEEIQQELTNEKRKSSGKPIICASGNVLRRINKLQ